MDKKEVRRAAARLRNLGLLVPTGRSDEDRLREAAQGARTEDAYENHDCPRCMEARRDTKDKTALCEPHLRKAMGC